MASLWPLWHLCGSFSGWFSAHLLVRSTKAVQRHYFAKGKLLNLTLHLFIPSTFHSFSSQTFRMSWRVRAISRRSRSSKTKTQEVTSVLKCGKHLGDWRDGFGEWGTGWAFKPNVSSLLKFFFCLPRMQHHPPLHAGYEFKHLIHQNLCPFKCIWIYRPHKVDRSIILYLCIYTSSLNLFYFRNS